METEATSFITPIRQWESLEKMTENRQEKNEEVSLFKDIFHNVVEQVYTTQTDADNKKYLLATGQLDDAHTLPIAEAKATLSLEVMIGLRNKALEAYNELIKMNL